ncbi:MAG: toprim domain-containing protein [Methylococcaceae bacterium]|nr:toprim domain-containing protein [Methylococcaceae bacterium]
MARLADEIVTRLKTEVSLLRLVESQGYQPKKQGQDFAIRCPFHDGDDTPSLILSPQSNLFHCFGCGAAGSVIDWVMKTQGVSFRFACEILQNDAGRVAESGTQTVKQNTATKLVSPLAAEADRQTALRQVLDYYHQTLKQSPEALAYLESRGLKSAELIDTFKLGYANRTLGYRLPEKNRKAGSELRGKLQGIGLLRESGHEHFNGSLVVPVMDEHGLITEVYGRKVLNNLRPGTAYHLYLPGPHRGVWNVAALKASEEIILCEALIDAMTFWVNGYRNVTASYGTGGFTDDHLAAFKQHGIKRVLIAYDRDEAGNAAAEKLAALLTENGIDAFRIQFPKGMDANDYAQQVKPAAKSLGLAIRKAEWLGKGKAPAITTAAGDSPLSGVEQAEELPSLAAELPEPTTATPLPEAPKTVDADVSEREVTLTLGDRHYRIRGLAKNLSYEQLKVNLLVSRGEHVHIDSFDLYQSRPRQTFIHQAGAELGVADEVIKRDLGRVLLKLEELQHRQIKHTLTPEKPEAPALDEAEQREALALLQSPGLLSRLLADFQAAGVVGEETNKLVGYLACVSRKLDKPLAVIIQSSSAAGKSSLMDAILNFVPEEERVAYSAMTGQSLFYLGEAHLKHKILAIAEEEGAATASYALKLLQSEGELTIASTGKDETTGNLVTKEYRVEGPVMLFLTTTAIDIDEELLNRCLVLSVNESREQTQAIHALQRRQQTLEGLLQNEDRKHLIQLHRNAQRLLRPLLVANPYAERLTFIDDKTRTRRDHMKYLTLIRAIALLHQYQRPVKTVNHQGQVLRYIEVTQDDIETANRLAHEVLGRSLDELPPQPRTLLKQVQRMVMQTCKAQGVAQKDYRFSRRDVRAFTGWSDGQLKIHCSRLTELEYLLVHRGGRGQSLVYELLYDGDPATVQKHLMGLIDPENLGYDEKKSGYEAEKAAPSQGQDRPKSGASQAGKNGANADSTRACGDEAENGGKNAAPGAAPKSNRSRNATSLAAQAAEV